MVSEDATERGFSSILTNEIGLVEGLCRFWLSLSWELCERLLKTNLNDYFLYFRIPRRRQIVAKKMEMI